MTMQDLRQYSSMRAEIQRLLSRLEALRLELAEEQSKETQKALSKLYIELDKLHRERLAKELEITRQIKTIQDAQIRISIQMHYIDGATWNEVADTIGGGNTETSCRKYVSRYFQKLSDMSQQE